MSNPCNQCKTELPPHGLFVGLDGRRMPNVVFICVKCGVPNLRAITALKPYTFILNNFPPKPGEWSSLPDGPLVCCPICKGQAGVKEPIHKIAADGTVTPSWVCPHNCGFHTAITLGAYAARRLCGEKG